jgi:hypothetical protein
MCIFHVVALGCIVGEFEEKLKAAAALGSD